MLATPLTGVLGPQNSALDLREGGLGLAFRLIAAHLRLALTGPRRTFFL